MSGRNPITITAYKRTKTSHRLAVASLLAENLAVESSSSGHRHRRHCWKERLAFEDPVHRVH